MRPFDHIAKTLETANVDYMSAAQRKYIDDQIDRILDEADRTAAEQAASLRTREEWEAREDDYAADNVLIPQSWEDVEADLMTINKTREEWDKMTQEEQEEEKRVTYERYLDEIMYYEKCAYVFCEGIFDRRRRGEKAKYCCPAHRKAQENANERYAKKGTYLPATAYIPKHAESVEKAQRSHELPFEESELFEEIAWYYSEKRTGGVRRDREMEQRTGIITRRKGRSNPAYDAFKRGETEGVNFLEFGEKIYKNRPIRAVLPPQKLSKGEEGDSPDRRLFLGFRFTKAEPVKVGGEMDAVNSG